MTRKQKILTAAGVMGVIGLYGYMYKDWLRPAEMQIYDRIGTGRALHKNTRIDKTAQATPVAFGFNRPYELTEVKVVSVAELATNKYARPLWHLVSDSNSIPVRGFNYGERIRGMRPEAKNTRADPLETNVTYRLFVGAKGEKGQFDFQLRGASGSDQ